MKCKGFLNALNINYSWSGLILSKRKLVLSYLLLSHDILQGTPAQLLILLKPSSQINTPTPSKLLISFSFSLSQCWSSRDMSSDELIHIRCEQPQTTFFGSFLKAVLLESKVLAVTSKFQGLGVYRLKGTFKCQWLPRVTVKAYQYGIGQRPNYQSLNTIKTQTQKEL